MESLALIKKDHGVESAKVCRWCLSVDDALDALTRGEAGQSKLQKLSECTGAQINIFHGVPSYLCAMCEERLKKMDLFRWRCNENNVSVEKFIEQQNTVNNELEITQDHLDHSGEQTVATPLSIKTEVSSPDTATGLHLNQKCCNVHQANRTYECCGNQPFEAEENPITIKLEYVDVDEQYRLQTNVILDHEQDDLQTNPLELLCQDPEDHSVSKNLCSDSIKLSIKTEDTTSDEAKDLPLNQKCRTVHQANRTYECCGNIPDDLFEVEENPISIKSEYEEVDGQHQQTNGDVLDNEQDNPKSNRKKQTHHCPHCSSSFAYSHSLKIHIRTHTGEKPYKCKVCNNAFRTSGNLTEHSRIHNKDQQHQCPYCSSKFAQSTKLRIHIRTHTGEMPYKCKVCDKAFRSHHSMVLHSKIHNEDQKHQCPYCSSKFVQSTKLRIHIRTHTGERPYKCKVCDKAFKSQGDLALHSKIHNKDLQHQCPYCSSTFAQSSNLKIHIRTHTGEKPYNCKVCDNAFRTSSNLADHSKIHNKDQQHQCPYCSSKFAQSNKLRIHIRTHTGERPYKCEVCDKSFHSSDTLAKHSRIHNKVQQHQCPKCPSKFAISSDFKNHIRIHTGEKPY